MGRIANKFYSYLIKIKRIAAKLGSVFWVYKSTQMNVIISDAKQLSSSAVTHKLDTRNPTLILARVERYDEDHICL